MIDKKVFVHIVLFNSLAQHGEAALRKTIESVQQQSGFKYGENLQIVIRDNGSSDGVLQFLSNEFKDSLVIKALGDNFGFAGGHNFGVNDFLQADAGFMLILNPDICLEKDALKNMLSAFEESGEIGLVCPKLLRANENLCPVSPAVLDAAGMELTTALRHFDRGSETPDRGQFDKSEDVFGASGACLLIKRECLKDLLLQSSEADAAVYKIFPQLSKDMVNRQFLFDEAFFAYREDADLAWRSQLYGWSCRYVASAVAYHRRVVLPERRKYLPAELNYHSVRNRFLLQLNNYSFKQSPKAFFKGVLWRNLLVICGVMLREQSSLPALKEVFLLWPRAIYRRKCIFEKAKTRKTIVRMKRRFHS